MSQTFNKTIFLDGIPVIGTALNPTELEAGKTILIRVDSFATSLGSDKITAWRKEMAHRQFKWQARYSYEHDHNFHQKFEERKVGSRLECFAPSGWDKPPDGWIITPHFHFDRCDGQSAHRATGIRWEPDRKNGWLKIEKDKTFVPLETYI